MRFVCDKGPLTHHMSSTTITTKGCKDEHAYKASYKTTQNIAIV